MDINMFIRRSLLKKLYETSGHLAHYKDDMYSPIDIEGEILPGQ